MSCLVLWIILFVIYARQTNQLGSFENEEILYAVDLQNHALKEFPDSLTLSCEHIQSLDVSHNEIEQLRKDDFKNCNNLKALYLHDNKLTTLDADVFELLSIETISLHDNHFQCDCSILWLVSWLQNVNVVNETYCHHQQFDRDFRIKDLPYILHGCSKSQPEFSNQRKRRAVNDVISHTPAEKNGCPLQLLIGTKLTFNFKENGNVVVTFTVDNNVVYTNTSSSFSHSFDAVGVFDGKIESTSGDILWQQSVTVINVVDFQVSFSPQINFQHNIQSNVNATFSLRSNTVNLTCLLTNPFNWTIDNKPVVGDTYLFEPVGKNSRSVRVSVDQSTLNMALVDLYLQIYDPVNKFNVTVVSNDECVSDKVNVSLTASGTDVNYSYSQQGSAPVVLQKGENEITMTRNEYHILTFTAKNVLSNAKVERNFTLSDIDVALTPQTFYSAEISIYKPKTFHVCLNYSFAWLVNTVRIQQGQSPELPVLSYTFLSDGTYRTVLKLTVTDKAPLYYETTITIVGHIDVYVPPTSNAHVDQLFVLSPLIKTPEIYRYRWVNDTTNSTPSGWYDGTAKRPPQYNVTFTTEGIFRVELEITTSMESVRRATNITVQHPIAGLTVNSSIVYVRFGESYFIQFHYEHISTFPYRVHLYDTKETVNEYHSVTGLNVYQWGHVASHYENIITFNISDNIDSYIVNVTVIALEPIVFINATLSRGVIEVGASVEGYVTGWSSNIGPVTYSWYSRSSSGAGQELIGIYANLSASHFNVSDDYIISVVAENYISNFTVDMKLIVDFINIRFDAFYGENRNKSGAKFIAVTPDVNTTLTAYVNSRSALLGDFLYKWYLDGVLQTKFDSDTFSYKSSFQGKFTITNLVSASSISKSSSLILYVQKQLTNVSLVSDVRNQSLINSSNAYLQYSFVYFQPTDALGIGGKLFCFHGDNQFYMATHPQIIYNTSLDGIVGIIKCYVNITNLVSTVSTEYHYLVDTYPKLSFSRPINVTANGSSKEVIVDVANTGVPSTLIMKGDGVLLPHCSMNVSISSSLSMTCSINFTVIGTSTVYAELANTFINVSKEIRVNVLEPVSDVEIIPSSIPVDRNVNISIKAAGGGNIKYTWGNSNNHDKSMIVLYTDTGLYSISVTVENEVSSISRTIVISVYDPSEFQIGSPRYIMRNSTHSVTYLAMGQTGAFLVRNPKAGADYNWQFVPIEPKGFGQSFSRRLTLDDTFSYRYLIFKLMLTEVAPPSDDRTKTLFVYVFEPVNNLQLFFDQEVVIIGKLYSLNITWDGTGSQVIRSLSMAEGTLIKHTRDNSKNFLSLYFEAGQELKNISLLLTICGPVNCENKMWEFQVKLKPEDVKLKIAGSEIEVNANSTNIISAPVNSTIIISLPVGAQVSNVTKYLIVNGTVINKQFFGLVNGEFVFNIDLPPGTYTLILQIGASKFSYLITIFRASCAAPIAEFLKYREHVKSQWFYSELNISSSCGDLQHKWSFEQKQTDSCKKQSLGTSYYFPRTLKGMSLVVDKPILEVPPRGFDVGDYCVRYTLRYGGTGSMVATFQLSVFGTPLVPTIAGGKYRVVGNREIINLDASETIDPDLEFRNISHLLFRWLVSDNVSDCFINSNSSSDISTWSLDNFVVNISSYCLEPKREYLVTLQVKRKGEDKHVQGTSQLLSVIDGIAPLVEIECFTCVVYKSYKYLRGKQIKLLASCTNCGDRLVEFEWQVYGNEDRKAIALTPSNRLSPLLSPALVLDKYTLDGKQTYTILCTVAVEGMDAVGTTHLELSVNLSPENGSCEISPSEGISMVDYFEITCSDWKDADNKNQPFIYWFLAGHTDNASSMSILYRGINPSTSIYLPLGNEANNFLYFEIWVQDSLGAYTIANKSHLIVKSSEQAKSKPVDFVIQSVLPFLKLAGASKDLNHIMTGIIAAVSFIGTKNATASQNKSLVLNSLVESASLVDASSIETVTQLVDAIDQIYKTPNSSNISAQSYDATFSAVTKIMDVADIFSTAGMNLEDETYGGFANVITKSLGFYVSDDYYHENERRRRSTLNDTSKIQESYALLQKLYEVILKSTVTGEQDRTISTSLIATTLSRRTGYYMRGEQDAGLCRSYADIEMFSNEKGVLGIFECSLLNSYQESTDRTVASLSYLSEDLNKFSIKNLSLDENIQVEIPNKLIGESLNSTYSVSPGLLYASALLNFSYVDHLPHAGIHIVIDAVGLETYSNGNILVYLLQDEMTFENAISPILTIGRDTVESRRTVFLLGSTYKPASLYYLGIKHNFPTVINLTLTTYTSRCVFWNDTSSQWESFGCQPTSNTTRDKVVCRCNHLTSFSSTLNLKPNPLDFSVLKKLDIRGNPVVFSTCIVIIGLYLIIAFFVHRRDRKDNNEELFSVPFIGSKDGFYQYELRVKTGMYPWAGTTAKVGIQIYGTGCTTKVRVIKTQASFQRNAIDIYRISLDRSIGKIHKIRVWHDNSGSNPSWYLERVVIRSLVNGEKFFFFCNRWIGTDCGDGMLDHDFHVADIKEMQKFSTIFYDVIGRGFSDYHLWLSIFERPKFSRFTRLQRITCVFTFVLSWMCVNATWFHVAPQGKVDLYIGFRGYSVEEIIIGLISAAIVFPMNCFIIFLFRKSRQRYTPEKEFKVWKPTRHMRQEVIDVDMVQLLDNEEEASNEFNLGVTCSPIRRKQKFKNIHDLVGEESTHEFIVLGMSSSLSVSDKLVLRTSAMTEQPLVDKPPTTPLTLPHSFASASILTMSPQHQYRVNSTELPRRSGTGEDNLVNLTLQRTSLSEEFLDLPSIDEQTGLTKPRLDPDELRSHMTDIVEQQLSSILNDLQSEKKHELALPSDYSSGIFHHEAITTSLIKKNEMLAEQLHIPVITELDPCTRWYLPFWCQYIAYLLCFAISCLSVIIIIAYGQQFGYDLSLKWLRVFFLQVLEDFFLAYPVVLLLVAFILAVLVKPLDLDQVDHADFYECPDGHVIQCDRTSTNEPVQPPSGYALEMLQREGLKRKRFRGFIKDLIFQALLMWFVVGICSAKYTNYLYPTTTAIEKELRENVSYASLNNANDYWSWVENTLLPHLNLPNSQHSSTEWKLSSQPIIRQVRSTVGTCSSGKYSQLVGIPHCTQSSFVSNHNFQQNWSLPLGGNAGNNDYSNSWVYRHHSSPKTFGRIYDYPSSGYEWHIPFRLNQGKEGLLQLKQNNWVDRHTRALFHDYVLLNTNDLRYAFISVLVEFSTTGYIESTFDVRYFQPNYFLTTLDYFSITCVILLALFTLFMAIHFLRQVHRKNLSEYFDFWNIHSLAVFLMSIASILLQIGQLFMLSDFRDDLVNGKIPYGVNARDMALVNDVIMYFFGSLAFLVILRCVRLLSYLNVYEYLSEVLMNAFKPMYHFIIYHLLVVFGFSGFMLLIFQSQVFEYRNFWQSFLSTLFNLWCRNKVSSTTRVMHNWGIGLSILWMLYMTIVARNMMRAIILNASHHKGANGIKNDESLFKYIWKKMRRDKKIRHVHFMDSSPRSPYYHIIPGEECLEDAEGFASSTEKFNDLPPLPHPTFDLDSNLITILASLDQMLVDVEWESEQFNQFNREICLEKSKAFYSIEKLTRC